MKYYIRQLVKALAKRRCPKLTEVVYDSQDNLVKINNGDWVQSWDLDHNAPANPLVSVRHNWDRKSLVIITPLVPRTTGIKVNGHALPCLRWGNRIEVIYDDMHWYMDNSDIFYIDLKHY